MSNLIIRTEDIKPEHLLELYVETAQDKKIVDLLKSPSPIVLEGSRGTGKSFLLRIAEVQLNNSFQQEHVLPIYVSFTKSSLLQTNQPNEFLNWMMARLCSKIVRELYLKGLLIKPDSTLSLLSGGQLPLDFGETRLEKLAKDYEESYKRPGISIDASAVPSVDAFKDAVEDTGLTQCPIIGEASESESGPRKASTPGRGCERVRRAASCGRADAVWFLRSALFFRSVFDKNAFPHCFRARCW